MARAIQSNNAYAGNVMVGYIFKPSLCILGMQLKKILAVYFNIL